MSYQVGIPPEVKGGAFIKYAKGLACAGSSIGAVQFLRQQFGDLDRSVQIAKAAVAPGTTADSAWAAPLSATRQAGDEFLEFVRPQTILGRIAARYVPTDTLIPSGTSGATAYWLGENTLILATRMSMAALQLPIRKLAALLPVTDQLLKSSSPLAERILRADLAAAIVAATDSAFCDDQPGDADRPAGVCFGAPTIASSGDLDLDVDELIDSFSGDLARAIWIANPRTCAALASHRHQGVGLRGGEFLGAPILASKSVAIDSSGGKLILLDPARIAVSDEGVAVDISHHCDIQLSDDPVTTAAGIWSSAWQQNLGVLRAIRYINWIVGSGAVAVLAGVQPALGRDS